MVFRHTVCVTLNSWLLSFLFLTLHRLLATQCSDLQFVVQFGIFEDTVGLESIYCSLNYPSRWVICRIIVCKQCVFYTKKQNVQKLKIPHMQKRKFNICLKLNILRNIIRITLRKTCDVFTMFNIICKEYNYMRKIDKFVFIFIARNHYKYEKQRSETGISLINFNIKRTVCVIKRKFRFLFVQLYSLEKWGSSP